MFESATQEANPMSDPFTIQCRENGPLVVRLPVRVVDHQGNEHALPTGKETIALCRCGHSKRKPFCDGSHKVVGFQAAETAAPPPAT
jgi:CDGSH-type Zn-finger protein